MIIKKYLILFIFIVLSSCSSIQKDYQIDMITTYQFDTRDAIDDCKTFDCDECLKNEKKLLIKYIEENKSPVILGSQQSIVTSITKKCIELKNDKIENNECVECSKFQIENKKLKNQFDKYNY